jgi:hypothetical protein
VFSLDLRRRCVTLLFIGGSRGLESIFFNNIGSPRFATSRQRFWGEGSASALQTLRRLEERRANTKPQRAPEERPSGD